MPVRARRHGTHPTRRPLALSATSLLALRHLLLQIIDKMLRTFLSQHFSRLVRHVGLLAQGLKFVPLRFSHHWFFHRGSFTRWLFHASRRSTLMPELL